jgi:hypothetical protein
MRKKTKLPIKTKVTKDGDRLTVQVLYKKQLLHGFCFYEKDIPRLRGERLMWCLGAVHGWAIGGSEKELDDLWDTPCIQEVEVIEKEITGVIPVGVGRSYWRI